MSKCESCKWFYESAAGVHGYCKLEPPVYTHPNPETGYPMFHNPTVMPYNFCSAWEEENDR